MDSLILSPVILLFVLTMAELDVSSADGFPTMINDDDRLSLIIDLDPVIFAVITGILVGRFTIVFVVLVVVSIAFGTINSALVKTFAVCCWIVVLAIVGNVRCSVVDDDDD